MVGNSNHVGVRPNHGAILRRMADRRTYGDACGVARALDLVGERWALMVVRELLLGPKRFTDLRAGLPHLSADVLTQRLRELEAAGILRRRTLPPPGAARVYELTAWGRELEDVVLALGRFGSRAPAPPAGATMSFDAHLLSLSTLFDPGRAGALDAVVALRLDGRPFTATVAGGAFALAPGEPPAAAAAIAAAPTPLIDVVHGRRAVADAESAGALVITGDRAVALRFLSLFPLPAPAAVPG